MMALGLSLDIDAALERLANGGHLTPDELSRLADSPDILPTGMLADTVRRRAFATRVTYLRVALVDSAAPTAAAAVPPAAHEVRLTGSPDALATAAERVAQMKSANANRTVSAFSWPDIARWAAESGGVTQVLTALADAGLDAVAELPLDIVEDPSSVLTALGETGFRNVRVTIAKAAPVAERLRRFLEAGVLASRFPHVTAIAPLPMLLNPLRPTTGYDDVKAVALARLVVPDTVHVQVDWLRYGPKLAQVALTFGADDLDNVSPSDAAPDGRRRAIVEELRKNIESAGFTAAERDGRFAALGE